MKILSRIAASVVLISLTAGQFDAQQKAPLNDAVEPFSIRTGSTFSATGGSQDQKLKGTTQARSIASEISEAQQIIALNHFSNQQNSSPELVNHALRGALRSLDPHSKFYDAAEWKALLDDQISEYGGIGAKLSNFQKDGVTDTYILSVVPGSPADRARLAFGDRIVAINGEQMTGRPSDEARDKIRGAAGSTFRLTIERGLTMRYETIEIRRGIVSQPQIPQAYLLRPGIGYIDLSEGFNYGTAQEFKKAVSDLKRQGMTSLILDLRGNGGGIVEQAVKIAEQFLPAGTVIATQRGRGFHDNKVWASSNPAPEILPLVLIVDENTASASEIIAGAFQDEDRALIVGEKTFGKGLVQSVIELPGRSGLTLTTARYMTPAGRSIQRDYTKIDRYEYYNNRKQAAVASSYFEAHTTTDRRVMGGNGIIPDIVAVTPAIGQAESQLIDPIFFFVRESLRFRPTRFISSSEMVSRPNHLIEPGGMNVAGETLTSFNQYLARAWPKMLPEAQKMELSNFIRERLNYYFLVSVNRSNAADHTLIANDPQVAKAIEVLPRAALLSELAEKVRKAKK